MQNLGQVTPLSGKFLDYANVMNITTDPMFFPTFPTIQELPPLADY